MTYSSLTFISNITKLVKRKHEPHSLSRATCILARYNKEQIQRISNREFKLWTFLQGTESRVATFLAEICVISHQSRVCVYVCVLVRMYVCVNYSASSLTFASVLFSRDRIRTMINVWGDAVGSAVVYKKSKNFLETLEPLDVQSQQGEPEYPGDKRMLYVDQDHLVIHQGGATNLGYLNSYDYFNREEITTKF